MDKIVLNDSVYFNSINITKFKTNFICIDFIIPLNNKTATKAALLAFVLKHGCKKYPTMADIACKAEELYGAEIDISIRKKGDFQVISFYIDYVNSLFISESIDMDNEAVNLLNNIVYDPLIIDGAFKSEYVENEKSNLKDIINARRNNKTRYAVKRCGDLMTKGEPHSVFEYGSLDELEKITAKNLFEYYNEFISKAVVDIFAIGNFCDNNISDNYKDIFSESRTPYILENKTASITEYEEVSEQAMVEQAKLSLGFVFDLGNIKQSCITLFLLLFAASPNSLLFMNVREKLSLCYYCSATIERLKNIMIVYSGVLPEKLSVAKEEILNQLDSIAKSSFSDEDLQAAKASYLNSLNSIFDNAASIEESALSKALRGEEFNIEQTKAEINDYTAEDIANVAKKMKLVMTYTLCNEVKSNE